MRSLYMGVLGDQKEDIFLFLHNKTVEDICPLLFLVCQHAQQLGGESPLQAWQ